MKHTIVLAIARHFATTLSGVLVAYGFLGSDEAATVGGALGVIFVTALSIADKLSRKGLVNVKPN